MATKISNLSKTARNCGIVGAGGAGFPTYKKLERPVSTVILNAAECEPLLHKDKELLKAFPEQIVSGMSLAMEAIGASEGIIAIKYKYTDVIDCLSACLPSSIRIHPLGDFYPAGDEFILVYEVLGSPIRPRQLPPDVDVLVQNVETILNLAKGQPVTIKYLTVAGAVTDPVTVQVPIGMSFRETIDLAGGPNVTDPIVLSGGVMMGRLVEDLSTPIIKTTGGLIVLPRDHDVARRYLRTVPAINRIGRSACDQCSFCTEMCPRYLLGHPIEPHKAMRTLGFVEESLGYLLGTEFCCECNLCSMYACPEDLDPKNVCVQGKTIIKQSDARWTPPAQPYDPHPLIGDRKIPVANLMRKLGLTIFENKGPLLPDIPQPLRVNIPLRQHIGAPATPTVKVGDKVGVGDVIGQVPEDQLGCPVHASIEGTVAAVNDSVIIERR
ncbi:MAG: 4Fe-4S dicluster domain-containing protein [bacterium]